MGVAAAAAGQAHSAQVGTVPAMDAEPAALRVVIIDDHQMVLDGLKAMLQPYRDAGADRRREQRSERRDARHRRG